MIGKQSRALSHHQRLTHFLLFLVCCLALVNAGTVKDSGGKLMVIGLVADNHYDTFPAGEKAPWEPMQHWLQGQVQRTTTTTKRRYDVAKDKMDEAIGLFNMLPDMSLVVNLGDLVNNDLMWNLKPILDAFNKAKAPHFSLLGNHDLRAHNDRFGKVNRTQEDWIRNKLGLVTWHYTLEYPPFKLIFLDSMVMEPESTNQTKKKELMAWLTDQLADAREHRRAVILFAHIPIGFQTNVLGPILRSYPHIIAAFFGHDHKGGYLRQDNTHCVTMQGQIETLANSFAVVEVYVDRVELSGFGRVPSRVMPIAPETVALIQSYTGPVAHDLALQGNQPLPPESLWEGEILQKPPPLLLHIPGYRKPVLPVSEANPGDTLFIKKTLPSLPRRIRTPSPEDAVQLNDAVKGAAPVVLSAEPAAVVAGDRTKADDPKHSAVLPKEDDDMVPSLVLRPVEEDAATAPTTVRRQPQPPLAGDGTPGDTAAVAGWSPMLAFVVLPLLVVAGACGVLLSSRRRGRRQAAGKPTVSDAV